MVRVTNAIDTPRSNTTRVHGLLFGLWLCAIATSVHAWPYGNTGNCMESTDCVAGNGCTPSVPGLPWFADHEPACTAFVAKLNRNAPANYTYVLTGCRLALTSYVWRTRANYKVIISGNPTRTISYTAHLNLRKAPNQTSCKVSYPKNYGTCPGENCGGTNPINLGAGNKYQKESDFVGAGVNPLRFERHYNSNSTSFGSALSIGWSTTYSRRIDFIRNWASYEPGWTVVIRDDGKALDYHQNAAGAAWTPDKDVVGTLQRFTDSAGATTGWSYQNADDELETYDSAGKLLSISTRENLVQQLTYSCKTVSATCPVVTPDSVATKDGLLIKVTDSDGRSLQFTYGNSGRLSTFTDTSGSVYTYSYSGSDLYSDNLTSVSYPGGSTRQYRYGESAYVSSAPSTGVTYTNKLTGLIDQQGIRFASWTYDDLGRATSSEHTGGVDRFVVAYSLGTSPPLAGAVTDPLGATRSFGFQAIENSAKNISISGPECSNCGPAKTTYDTNGFVASRTDRNGNLTCYTNNTRGLETQRVEGLTGTSCPGTTVAGVTRTIATTWHPTYRLLDVITESGRTTDFDYDASGNLTKKTVTNTADGSTRVWQWTYNASGQVLTADGPRTDVSDVTTYTYNNCTTGYGCGQLATVTNALGQVTTYSAYDANGRPTSIIDPNGVATTLTYNFRGQVTSRTQAGETTTFGYDPVGQLTRVTLPDTSYLEYVYDAAHRMTEMRDNLGNRVVYTLDPMGNRTAENVYDPSNALRRTHSRVYSTVNRLYQDVNAAGTAAVTTTYGYDPNGNQTAANAPLGRNSTNTYDGLNRLKQVTDPMGGTTKFGYDVRDNLTSVTDPKGLVTTYQIDGFGDLKRLTSPDTGITDSTYDPAGNLLTSTDARGVSAVYGYDTLNRVTSIGYGDQAITFGYDNGTNGVGRLTSASDANHTMSWSYDGRGRVTGKGQTVGGITTSIGYAYTSGRLTNLTTPSGQLVSYGYDSAGRISSITVNGTTILSNVLYEPFGGTAGWTWGNGTYAVRTYDTDGKITQVDSAGLRTYGYDDAFRITGITDLTTAANSWSFAYDGLDRLTSASAPTVTRGWTYDANGNRLTETGSSPSTYTVSTTSNRLNAVTGTLARTYGYDAAGNVTGYAGRTFTYNNRGRLVQTGNAGINATYVYNALGQLVKRTRPAGTSLYAYDESGHLLGEYDGTGALVEELVWLGDIPVASIRTNSSGTGVGFFYVHTDHLNTPTALTQPSTNTIVWRWDRDPFGTTPPNTDPDANGLQLPFSQRFPGQTAFDESGLNYNYFRDYDPQTGRYVESDPVGLKAGVNTYGYVDQSPLIFSDPDGLGKQGGQSSIGGNDPAIPRGINKNSTPAEINQAIRSAEAELAKPGINPARAAKIRAWIKVAKRGFTRSVCPPLIEELSIGVARSMCLAGDANMCQIFLLLGGEVVEPEI